MALDLSNTQRAALEAGQPLEITDGREVFYLFSKHQFERLKRVLAIDEVDPSFFEFSDTEMFGMNDE